ncbi:RidA family protein [Mesorhizobium sp. 1M-11]|uniref:RidA family protein n=1 Tax=Mesorhizobium sp. 1M-11 TaxID=1529006 RepID=UPI000ADE96FE|nr:RidA family protein [Mesorhizobium sp. 1M-11]
MSRVVKHAGIAYLAGMTAEDASQGFEDQMRQVLAKADESLKLAGTDRSRLLTATIWLSDMAYFAEMNTMWESWIDPSNPPARATAECKLARPTLLVEILFTAAC